MADSRVAIVLSGGGARGAYEIGALSVLLPALEARGERPRIIVGTSVGAFNAALKAPTLVPTTILGRSPRSSSTGRRTESTPTS